METERPERLHELGIAQTATYYGLVNGIASMAGTYLGGTLADRFAHRDTRVYAWLPAAGVLISFPFYFAALIVDDWLVAIAILLVPSFLNSLWLGPALGTIQNIAPQRSRALASAILLFITNIIGLGFGPFLVGVMSDLLVGTFAEQSLRWAIIFATAAYIWAGTHFILAGRTIAADLKSSEDAA